MKKTDPQTAEYKDHTAFVWKNNSNLYGPDLARFVLGVMSMSNERKCRESEEDKEVHLILLSSKRVNKVQTVGSYSPLLTKKMVASCPNMLYMLEGAGQLHFNHRIFHVPDRYSEESHSQKITRRMSKEGKLDLFSLNGEEIVDIAIAVLKYSWNSLPYEGTKEFCDTLGVAADVMARLLNISCLETYFYDREVVEFRQKLRDKLLAEFNVTDIEQINLRFRYRKFSFHTCRDRERIKEENQVLFRDWQNLKQSAKYINSCIERKLSAFAGAAAIEEFEASKSLLQESLLNLHKAMQAYELTNNKLRDAYDATL